MSTVGAFEVITGPETDLWRAPPNISRDNVACKNLSKMPLKSFGSARVAFSASWRHKYDQAGVSLRIQLKDEKLPKWVKAGVEFYNDKPHLSVVTTDNWSDWSLSPIAPSSGSAGQVVVEAVRIGEEGGQKLWVYQILLDKDGNEVERVPLRECAWVFAQEADSDLSVDAYAARPAKGEGPEDKLSVQFHSARVVER